MHLSAFDHCYLSTFDHSNSSDVRDNLSANDKVSERSNLGDENYLALLMLFEPILIERGGEFIFLVG